MLAPNQKVGYDFSKIVFPAFGSVKLDGMRAKITPEGIFSRAHKKQNELLHHYFTDLVTLVRDTRMVLDGEIWSPSLSFNEIMSEVADPFRTESLEFHVFDILTVDEWYEGGEAPYMDRVEKYRQWVQRYQEQCLEQGLNATAKRVAVVDQTLLRTPRDIQNLFEMCVNAGHEGCMVRSVRGRYKHGRATINEGLIYKFKNWNTVEARIVGFKRATRMKEEVAKGERTRDVFGFLERSHKKETREYLDAVGSVEVELKDGTRCFVGGGKGDPLNLTGKTLAECEHWLGKMVEIESLDHGKLNKLRMGQIVRTRPDLD